MRCSAALADCDDVAVVLLGDIAKERREQIVKLHEPVERLCAVARPNDVRVDLRRAMTAGS